MRHIIELETDRRISAGKDYKMVFKKVVSAPGAGRRGWKHEGVVLVASIPGGTTDAILSCIAWEGLTKS